MAKEVVRIRLPVGAAMAEVTCFEGRQYVSSLPRPMHHWDADHKGLEGQRPASQRISPRHARGRVRGARG